MTIRGHQLRVEPLATAFRRPVMRPRKRLQPAANDVQLLGRYRITLDGIGECAIVHRDAGDGAPFLSRDIYEALRFLPCFDTLPLVENVAALGPLAENCNDQPMVG